MTRARDKVDAGTLLRLLSNPVNLELLILLNTKPSYPRELARLTGRDETDISRRLRLLEAAGLVEGSWRNVAGRNIKMYRLSVRSFKIEFSGKTVRISGTARAEAPVREFHVEVKPPRQPLFVGRREELDLIRGSKAPIIVVWGISGIGKTSLVAKALEGSEPLYWHTLTRLDTAEYILWRLAFFLSGLGYDTLLNYMGLSRRSLELARDLAVQGLRRTGSTLVFDDYQLVEGGEVGALVRWLALRARDYRVVIISRKRPRGLPYHEPGRVLEVLLGGLSLVDSMKLLREKGVKLAPEEMVQIYSATAGHPLLLLMFAEAQKAGGTRTYEGEVSRYLWRELYSTLSEAEKKLLAVLAAFEEPQPPDLISQLAGVRSPEPILYRLSDKALVEVLPEGFRAHPVVRRFMALERRSELYIQAAEYRRRRGGWTEKLQAINYYIAAGAPAKAAEILAERVLSGDLSFLAYIDSYREAIDKLLRENLPRRARIYVLHEKAVLTRLAGRPLEAIEVLEEAIRLAEALNDERMLVELKVDLGEALVDLGDAIKSLDIFRDAIKVAERLGDKLLLLAAYAGLVNALSLANRLDEAYQYMLREVELAKRMEDPFYMLMGKLRLAKILQYMGRREEAVRMLDTVYTEASGLGLDYLLGLASLGLASLHNELGDYEAALRYSEEAERLFKKLGIHVRDQRLCYYKALALAGLGRTAEALETVSKALRATNGRSPLMLPMLHWLAGDIHASMGRIDEALKHFSQICRHRTAYTRKAARRAAETLRRAGLPGKAEEILEECGVRRGRDRGYPGDRSPK